jgi:hypothetical protein
VLPQSIQREDEPEHAAIEGHLHAQRQSAVGTEPVRPGHDRWQPGMTAMHGQFKRVVIWWLTARNIAFLATIHRASSAAEVLLSHLVCSGSAAAQQTSFTSAMTSAGPIGLQHGQESTRCLPTSSWQASRTCQCPHAKHSPQKHREGYRKRNRAQHNLPLLQSGTRRSSCRRCGLCWNWCCGAHLGRPIRCHHALF